MLPPGVKDENLLVGLETSDDAGVYKISEDLALIQTVDYFTPVVDEPYQFGQIAAANALSDVYAMGGKPLTAMNLIGFPVDKLELSVMAEILKGGQDKIHEAGAILVGGHSVQDNEPKYGLSITGTVHPDKVLTNANAKPGDCLVLTKPLGIGIITTAIKGGLAATEVINEAIKTMADLNKTAAEVMAQFPVHACTDISGFGLLGHAGEMARASLVGIEIQSGSVPVIEAAREYAAMGLVPAGTRANLKFMAGQVAFSENVQELEQIILADAITSGGLLISLPLKEGQAMLKAMRASGVEQAAIIGEVIVDEEYKIYVNRER